MLMKAQLEPSRRTSFPTPVDMVEEKPPTIVKATIKKDAVQNEQSTDSRARGGQRWNCWSFNALPTKEQATASAVQLEYLESNISFPFPISFPRHA